LGAELLQKAQSLLSEEERRIAEHHRRGKEWNEIAQLMNESPEAIRKRLTRAISRVLEVLQLKREDS
jgi:DNA-binding NarL/FixJ family response regulator